MKHIDVDSFFNRKFIIRELGYSLNDDDTLDASVAAEGKTESLVVVEVVQYYVRTVGELLKSTVVPEKRNE